jgi:hypothetical protein
MIRKQRPDVHIGKYLFSRMAIWGLTVFLLCLPASPALAGTPGKINYQGILTDTDTGDPFEGTHTLIFRIYDLAEDGTELWSESQVVEVGPAGVFSVILGYTNPIGLPFSVPYWLEVEVSGEVLVPRRELVSVPYSFRSKDSDDADSLGGVHSGDYVVEGEVGVVTTDMISDGAGSGLDADMLDGLGSDAFADSGHSHDDRYYTQGTLDTAGSINDIANPVDWTKLKSVPYGFADGTDDVGSGDGHSLDADDGNPIDALYVDSAGRVGIGTTTPTIGRLQIETADTAVYAKSTTGPVMFAVAGSAAGSEPDAAIVGTSTTRAGLSGVSSGGDGIVGVSSAPAWPAIRAIHSGDGPAIVASNATSYHPAIRGSNSGDGNAIEGFADTGIGVVGKQLGYTADESPGGYLPAGYFGGKNGVVGLTKEHAGWGVVGVSKSPTAYAGRFISDGDGVLISTPAGKTGLSVSGGNKLAVVATADGARSLYCEEASEVWFADYGFGSLEGGTAVVAIDPVFAQTVNLNEPYHVFLQAYGDADLYVASRDSQGFEVRMRDGDPGVEFSYRLVAKRLGFEEKRLARAPWADNDRYLFPEKAARQQGEE